MTFSVKPAMGTDKTILDVGRHAWKHRAALKLALNEIGSEVVNETANIIFRGKRTGRIYTYRGRRHQASAPGESPANRTGRLARSGDYRVRGYHEMTVGEAAEYAGFLESGTKNIDPRPHLIVAVRRKSQDAVNTILEYVDDGIKA